MREQRLDDVWASRDYPVLLEVTRRFDEGDDLPHISDVAEALEMDPELIVRAAKALARVGLVELHESAGGPWGFASITSAAYSMTGLHPDPDTLAASLAAMLKAAADDASDQEERGRLWKAADAVGRLTGAVGTGVLTAWLTGQLPH